MPLLFVKRLENSADLYELLNCFPLSGTRTATGLITIEPSLTYLDAATASTGPNVVSVSITNAATGTNNVWSAAALSQSGTCYFIKDDASPAGTGTKYGSGTVAANCTGTQAVTSGTLPAFP